MNKLDLIIEFCESMANMHIKGSAEALAAARELRVLEPVLYKWFGNGWSYEKPTFPTVPLYALGESNE